MAVVFVEGDMFASPGLQGLAHGCNCAGAMGKGVAIEFRQRYPDVYNEYKPRCKSGDFDLGDVFEWQADQQTIFNLGTQKTWRTKATLDAIEQSTQKMLTRAAELQLKNLGIPQVGAGLGGLRWTDLRALLLNLGKPSPVNLVVFEKFIPDQAAQW